jgi:hypothetical protein
MSIPGFTAEQSLLAGQPHSWYYGGNAPRVTDAGIMPQATRVGGGFGGSGLSSCFVDCIRHALGNPQAVVGACAAICKSFPGPVAF